MSRMSSLNLTEVHNEMVTMMLRSVVHETINAGGGAADLVVIAESTMLGLLLAAEHHFGTQRAVSAEWIETIAERVAERLAATPERS